MSEASPQSVRKGLEVVGAIVEHALRVIEIAQRTRRAVRRNAAPQDRRAEQRGTVAHQRPQMVDRAQLLVHAAGQAMEYISESHGSDGRGAKRKRGKQIELVQRRLEAGEPLCRAVETIAIGVEQGEALQLWR